eukprot:4726212-Pleurochrysis_carterae.AAC.3
MRCRIGSHACVCADADVQARVLMHPACRNVRTPRRMQPSKQVLPSQRQPKYTARTCQTQDRSEPAFSLIAMAGAT